MKICLLNLGLLPIPRVNYGSTERIIWDTKINLEKLGHVCDIKFPEEVKNGEYDIISSFTWNQTLAMKKRGFKVVNHVIDHNLVRWGPQSDCFKQNQIAINESDLTIFPNEEYINLISDPYKTHYLSLAVNIDFFKNTAPLKFDKHKLLVLAANGYPGNPLVDRKGFIPAINAARELNLDITICGPSSHNRPFLESRRDIFNYDKLTILYDLNDEEILKLYKSHTIFVHPSELEFGHPCLTILEAMACGLPVVGSYLGKRCLPGLRKIENNYEVSIGILDVIGKYTEFKRNSLQTAAQNNYSVYCERLLKIYDAVVNNNPRFDSKRFKTSLINCYKNTTILSRPATTPPPDDFIFNFINGAYIEIKGQSISTYNVDFINRDTNQSLYKVELKTNHWAKCSFQYFINYDIRVKDKAGKLIKRCSLDLKNKNVLIDFQTASLGDTIAAFPFVEEFRKKHDCRVIVSTFHNYLFDKKYPDLNFIRPGEVVHNLYAQYSLGVFLRQEAGREILDLYKHPSDPRTGPLQKTFSDILGLDFKEIKPEISAECDKLSHMRHFDSPYVCISTASTAQCKQWNYPGGWQKVVDYLNHIGLKVILIQKEEEKDLKNVIILENKEDLLQNARYLKNCKFFIGLSSGVSWLAWALGKPVLMISGITKEFNEFKCIKINPAGHICNGCFNDKNFVFDSKAKGKWDVCAFQQGTPRQFECTKTITPERVIGEIDKLLSEFV